MNINLKLFNAFIQVAEGGSLRAAASQANRSMPALSMQIRQLEEQIGVPLFDRSKRGLSLTSAGHKLLHSTRTAMQELEFGLRHIRQTIDLEQGEVVFSCSPTIATSVLPPVLSEFLNTFPGVRLQLREQPLSEQIDSLHRQEVDFSVGPEPEGTDATIVFTPMFTDEFLALFPSGHPLAGKKSITLKQFLQHPILMLSREAGFSLTFDKWLRSAQLQPKQIRCEAKQITTLIEMVRVGLGGVLLSRVTLDSPAILEDERIAVVPLRGPKVTRVIGILSRRNAPFNPAAARLQELIAGRLKAHQ